MIKPIHQKLFNASQRNPWEYISVYKGVEKQYLNWLNNFKGVKTDILLNHNNSYSLNWLRFTFIFSDYTSILPQNRNDLSFHDVDPKLRLNVKIPNDVLREITKNNSNLSPKYAQITNKHLKNLMKEIEPVVQVDKAIYRPSRVFLSQAKINTPTINRIENRIYFVDPCSKIDYWIFKDSREGNQDSIPILNELPYFRGYEKKVFEITVPYFDGIPFNEMIEILSEEKDYLSNIRRKMGELIDQSKKVDNFNFNDINTRQIQPQIDEIERRFKSIKRSHRLRVSGLTV